MDSCKNIEKYKNQLTEITNNNNLTIGMTYYILKDLLGYVTEVYNMSLKEENKIQNEYESEKIILDNTGQMLTKASDRKDVENEQQTFTSAD